jgi:hypothetical protein
MKISFSTIANAVHKIKQSQNQNYCGEYRGFITMCETLEQNFNLKGTASLHHNQTVRQFSVEQKLDGSFIVCIPESHFKSPIFNPMRTIKSITDKYKSFYAANKALGLKQSNQLQRHVKSGAIVDENGQVWIKTGSPIVALIRGAK